MAKYYIYEGTPVEFPHNSGNKYDKFMQDNEHLAGHEATKAEYDAVVASDELERKRHSRRKAYANGDYIDAIMKHLNLKRLAGEDLCEDMDAALQHWLGVKSRHPLD